MSHACHRCGVPVRDRTVRRRRRRRIGHPRRCGRADICVGDGRQSSDVRGNEEEEQREAREAVPPQRDGPSAQERHNLLHRFATRCNYVLHHRATKNANSQH
jgi:hypothetical protein